MVLCSLFTYTTSIDLNLSMYNGTVFIIYLYTKKTVQPWTTSLYFDLTFCQAAYIVVGHACYLPDKWPMSGSNN